jgi:acetyl esterase/lipase
MKTTRLIPETMLLLILLAVTATWAAEQTQVAEPRAKAKAKSKAPAPVLPQPTAANVPYGDHPRQVLDFWKATAAGPTPVLFFIHGGGWVGGDKNNVGNNGLKECLAAGISVVSINYRYVTQAQEAGVKPPVEWPLRDAARALQFVRSKAGEWGLDKTRIGASGGSAGACSSLWLAFHDDLADAASSDPIARESTRLSCAAVMGAQTSLDPHQMRAWISNSKYGGHAFGFRTPGKTDPTEFQRFYDGREQVLPWIKEYSPYEWVSADDPPIMLYYSAAPAPAGEPEKDPTHSAMFGVKLAEKLQSAGVNCHLVYPGSADQKYAKAYEFLIDTLKSNGTQ